MSYPEIKLRALTPIWTGGVGGEMDRFHETGLMGSLRWWYEAIVRGLGGAVCDPKSDIDHSACPVCQLFGATGLRRAFRLQIDAPQPRHPYDDNDPTVKLPSIPLPSGHILPPHNRVGGWFLQQKSRTDQSLNLRLIPLAEGPQFDRLRIPLAIISRHASLGAKVASGYGVVILEGDESAQITTSHLDTLQSAIASSTSSSPPTGVVGPDLRDFFFAKLSLQDDPTNANWWRRIPGISEAMSGQVTDGGITRRVYAADPQDNNARRRLGESYLASMVASGILPLAPAVRRWLRFQWAAGPGWTEQKRNYVLGTTNSVCPQCYTVLRHNNRMGNRYTCPGCRATIQEEDILGPVASKINVTYAYRTSQSGQWQFRIWGWLPSNPPAALGLPRDTLLGGLRDTLKDQQQCSQILWAGNAPAAVNLHLIEWHSRHANQRNGRQYLEFLLGL